MSAKPKLDPRTAPFRPDLAAASLYGKVEAERYVDGVACQVRTGFIGMREAADWEARQSSQLLFGEIFTVLEESDGWAWGQNSTDDYVGYLRLDALEEAGSPATHQVSALRTYLFAEPDLKTPPLDLLPFQARVAATGESDNYIEIAGGGWIYGRHLKALSETEADPVAAALRFAGTPYLWGGRTSLGLDCSALVQLALAACGIAAPRDSDLQRATLGKVISKNGKGITFERGDLVFLPGHVGLMADADTLVHANAFHMEVVAEPLADVLARAGDAGIISVNRL
jgi:cell wall-associated NlpC family hydrolase